MHDLRIETLYEGELFRIFDASCRPHCANAGAEEYPSSNLLLFPRRGVFVRHTSRKNATIADPTQALFFNADQAYRVSHPIAGGDDCTAFAFSAQSLQGILDSPDATYSDSSLRRFFSSASVSVSLPAAAMVQQLRRYLKAKQTIDKLAVEESCFSLLHACLAEVPQPTKHAVGRVTAEMRLELVGRTRYLLASHFREALDLKTIAGTVFSSQFHLARIFRRETGLSLHRYISRLRLQEALRRLLDSSHSLDLTLLALDLGFCSHAHFTHAFRQEVGLTPSQFRATASNRLLRELSTILKA